MKIWAICSGGDWYDASVKHLILPDGMNLEKENKLYLEWFCKRYKKTDYEYKTFSEWLILKGAKIPSNDILEEYWEL